MSKKQMECIYAKKCGGCQLQNMTYDRQLRFKQAKVVKWLGRFHRVNDIIGMENPYHYRNKVQSAFALTRRGKIVSGVYQSSTKTVVNVDSCMIEDEMADRIIVAIRKMLPDFKILPYSEYTKKGFLRHILVKRSFSTNQIMVVFIGAGPIFPQKDKITKALIKKFPEITTVVFNINQNKASMLLGDKQQVLYGKGYIEDVLCGLKFRISARSFYQVNPVQTEVLYNTAMDFANISENDVVIDAYCGTGTIGLVASKKAREVIGVEVNADAVKDAKINAKINGIDNAEFYNEDATEFMEKMALNNEKADVVFIDPPRAGSTKRFLKSLVKLSPKKIVYVSCNPETQRRDLFELTDNGYEVKIIQPVDMFPHTNHVETVVLLEVKHQ